MTKSAVILSRATCPLVEIVAACRLCRLLPLSHASRRAATGRLSRFTPARGRSITTPSQHVRPALRAARPRFAALLSSCAQGSALLIPSVSLCRCARSARPAATARYGRYLPAALLGALFSPPQNCSLSLPPAAVAVLPLRRGSDAEPSRLARRAAGSVTLRVAMPNRRFAPFVTAPCAFTSPARRLSAGFSPSPRAAAARTPRPGAPPRSR